MATTRRPTRSRRSTNRKFNPDASTASLLHKKYENSTIFQICQEEASASIDALDPRGFFNVIAFGSEVRRWEKTMVAASGGFDLPPCKMRSK